MLKKTKFRETEFIAILFSLIICVVSVMFSNDRPILSGVALIGCGILLYGKFALERKSFFDCGAIFSGIWFTSIGLACFRFNVNQRPWSIKTWLCLYLAYAMFLLGYTLRKDRVKRTGNRSKRIQKLLRIEKVSLSHKRLVNIAFVLPIVVLASFAFEVIVLGFIPLFSKQMDAYVRFHISGVHYLTVSCVLVFPFSFYVWKNCRLYKWQKIFIVIANLASATIPFLIVSRQLFFLYVLLAMFAVSLFGKFSEWKIILVALLSIVVGWGSLSHFRRQSSDYLFYVFDKPKSSVNTTVDNDKSAENTDVGKNTADATSHTSNDKNEKPTSEQPSSSSTGETEEKKYVQHLNVLPMKLYQPYMYIAFNFDNFNYVVESQQQLTFGARTLFPFIALSGAKFIFPQLVQLPVYQLNKFYTTYPIVYTAYSDWGILGVALYMLLIGYISGICTSKKTDNVIKGIFIGLVKYCLIFSFFTNFFANATIWFYFILLSTIYLYLNFNIKRKEGKCS